MFALRLPHPNIARALVASTLCVGLGACVGVRVPKLPTPAMPAHWRNVDTSPRLGPTPSLVSWWKCFDDPRLDALVGAALHDNLNVEKAVWNLRAARALEDAAGATFLPKPAFNTLEQPNAGNTASYFQAGFDATWELGLFGRSGGTAHVANANTGAADAELQDARVSLVAEVVREYLQLRAAQRDEALLHTAARAAQKKVALLRVQERLQLASRITVEEGIAAAAKAAARLAGPRAAIAQHAQTLALLLGKSEPEPAWLVPRPLPKLVVGNVSSLPVNLLRTRPDIRYAESRILKATGELGIATADMYPRLAFGASLTFAALVKGQTHLGEVNNSFAIGPIINLPIFNWGQRRAVRNARENQLQAALVAYKQTVLKGVAEVETDLATFNAFRQRVKDADAEATASRTGLQLSRKLAGLGQSDALQLAKARLALAGSELDRVNARLAYGLAFVTLYKALGGAPLPKQDRDDARTSETLPSPSGGRGPAGADEGSLPRIATTLPFAGPSRLPLSRGEGGNARGSGQP